MRDACRRDALWPAAALISFLLPAAAAVADEFDRLEGPALAALPESKAASKRDSLTVADLGSLPTLLRGTRAGLIVVRTDQGNLARLLVEPAFRKAPGKPGEGVPVLLVERFATYEAGKATTRLARGQDVILFDGFRVDLDTGQVVPEGQGGDLLFRAEGEGGPRLLVEPGATMYTLAASPVPPASNRQGKGPSPGRVVLPGDFAGRYRMFTNGQLSGTLDLDVDEKGAITGQYRSDARGSSFPVTGQVAADVPQKVRFAVAYPRTRHEYEGYLWTLGKGAMAGTVVMQDHPYGFFALREGGRYAPDDAESEDGEATPGAVVVELKPEGGYLVDGKPVDRSGLQAALKTAGPARPVRLVVGGEVPLARLAEAVEALRASGVAALHLAPTLGPPPQAQGDGSR